MKYNKFENDYSYDEKSESYSERLKSLRDFKIITPKEFRDLGELKVTRDQFAHSFLELEHLSFRGEILEKSGSEFLRKLDELAGLFEKKFLVLQHHQVNWRVFNLVFGAVYKPTSKTG